MRQPRLARGARVLPELTLRARVMLSAFLALSLVMVTYGLLRQRGLAQEGRAGLAERAALLVSIQSAALSVPMWNLDHEQVAAGLRALAADPDFLAACVVEPGGAVVARLQLPGSGGAALVENPGTITAARNILYFSRGEVRILGTLHLKLSTRRLDAALRRQGREETGSLVFLLAAVLLILFLALRRLISTLDLLADALTRLAAGDRETPIPASDRDDELGAVARGLEAFRDTAFRLVEAERAYRALFDDAPMGIYAVDAMQNVQSLNAAALRITDYPDIASLAEALRRDDGTGCYVCPEQRAEFYRMMRETGIVAGMQVELRRRDGSHRWVSMTGRAVRDETGRLLRFTGTMEDITDRLRLREEERLRVRAAMQSASDAILIVDAAGDPVFANPAFERCFGYSRADFSSVGGLPAVIKDPAVASGLALALKNSEPWQAEADIMDASGQAVPLLIRVSAMRDDQGASFGAVVICTDLSDRRQAEARIQQMAHYDWLTGLPNRVLFRERLNVALAQATNEGASFAVLCVDLDRFKVVNDTMGHPAGDRLLQLAAARLQSGVRDGDTVARVGGDEFILIQLGIFHPEQAILLAERLIQDLSQPFDLDGREAQIGACIGIALAPLHGADPDRLLGFADVALYEAKMQGKRQVRIFTPDMDRMLRRRTELERDLRRAVGEGALHLHYQPQYLLATEELVGAEALLRWNDASRGAVSPADFVPVAEECGLIHPIGRLVLQTACRAAAEWPGKLRVAVNVSPAQFHGADLIGTVRGILEETGLAPARLELEITEGVLLRDTEATRATLLGLKGLGVRITLDDFGTGYSSLSYLRRMPFDKIKIDRSFVAALGHDPAATSLVRSIIGLARGLGLEINAEGVETPLQARLLREEGCLEVQGFYFGPPASAEDFAALRRGVPHLLARSA